MIHPARRLHRRGLLAGVVAGVIGLGCCVGPAVAALLGLTSATAAIGVAENLYSEWGWAFKAAAAFFALAAIIRARRRRSCSSSTSGIGRFAVVLAVTALVTYALLYAATSWLGTRETAAGDRSAARATPLVVTDATVEARVSSALSQIRKLYPGVDLAIESASSFGIMVKVWWERPDPPVDDSYLAQQHDTFLNSREATIRFLQAVARSNSAMTRFGAYEDRLLVPIWSRRQILDAGDPVSYRDFERYAAFQLDAVEQSGYFHFLDSTGSPVR